MTPYEEGREAYFRGDYLFHNPYDQSDGYYDEWVDGYEDAMTECEGIRDE